MAKEKIQDITVYRTPWEFEGNAEYYAIVTTFESGDYQVERRLRDESFDERDTPHYDYLLQWERQSGEVKNKGSLYLDIEGHGRGEDDDYEFMWKDELHVRKFAEFDEYYLELTLDMSDENYRYETTRKSMRGVKKLINQFLFPEDYGRLPFRGKGKFHAMEYYG